MLRASVIIPTYHRPEELTLALGSILAQTRLPDELIVVDDGDLPGLPLQTELQASGIHCRLLRKDKPGLTESRNLGIARSHGDVILFFDDDVELLPDYVERLMAVYEKDTDAEIGGVGGVILNHKPLSASRRWRRILDRLFLISGPEEGRVLASGFCANYGDSGDLPAGERAVDFLAGAACSYRRSVFEHLSFTPGYRDFAFGEDKDFSYRVSRRQRLVLTPEARLYHYESPNMRPAPFANGRKYILGRYLFFRDLVHRAWWDWPLFWYAYSGYLLIRLLILLISRRRADWERIRGVLAAAGDIVARRLPRRLEA